MINGFYIPNVHVYSSRRFANSLYFLNDMGLVVGIFQINPQNPLLTVFDKFVITNITFAFHNLGYFGFNLRARDIDAVESCFPGIANPG